MPAQPLTPAYGCMHEMQTHYPDWGHETVRDSSRGRMALVGGTRFRRRATQHGKVGSLLGTLQMVSSKTNVPALTHRAKRLHKKLELSQKTTFKHTTEQTSKQAIKPGESTTQTCSTLTRELLRTKKKRDIKTGGCCCRQTNDPRTPLKRSLAPQHAPLPARLSSKLQYN